MAFGFFSGVADDRARAAPPRVADRGSRACSWCSARSTRGRAGSASRSRCVSWFGLACERRGAALHTDRGVRRRAATSSSARTGTTTSNPALEAAPRHVELAARAVPVLVQAARRASASATSATSTTDRRRHQLDIYRTRRRRTGRAGAAADPRRRLDDRQQGPAGPAAACTTSRRAAGCASRQLPPVPRPRGPTTSSTASARWRGSGSNIAEYGGDPDYVVVTGGSAGGHLTALIGLTPNDPQFQPGFEDVDTPCGR